MEQWAIIRALHAQGKSIRTIAAELALARNTVRGALRSEQPPRYQRPKRVNPQLVPFADQIAQMLLVQQFVGSRILRELRGRGYRGGATALYDYLAVVKAQAPDRRVTVRFETPPGQQGQFDWSPYTVALGDVPTRVLVYGLTLGFSRRKHYWVSLDETQTSIFEAIEASLRHFGGAPKELLVDNAKALVTEANPERFTWNRHFLELCGHYAIRPVACHPYRPQTKGKIERPFAYLEEQFIKGGAWASLEALAADLARFVAEDLDVRVHSTTRERPLERFALEQPRLTPLPASLFVSSQSATRQVSWDCLVSYRGSRYSVPWQLAGQRVWVQSRQGQCLFVRDGAGQEVTTHQLSAQKGATTINPAHYVGLRAGLPKTRVLLQEAFVRRFPDQPGFLEGLWGQHPTNATAHLRAILGLAELYPHDALAGALGAACTHQTFSHRFIRSLLEAGGAADVGPAAPLTDPPPRTGTEFGSIDLGVYQRRLEAGR